MNSPAQIKVFPAPQMGRTPSSCYVLVQETPKQFCNVYYNIFESDLEDEAQMQELEETLAHTGLKGR